MIKTLIPEKTIFNRRTLTEVSVVILALAITFYAGYTLGQDKGIDDRPSTIKTTKQNSTVKNISSTSTQNSRFIVN